MLLGERATGWIGTTIIFAVLVLVAEVVGPNTETESEPLSLRSRLDGIRNQVNAATRPLM
jgi:hypothetical protein